MTFRFTLLAFGLAAAPYLVAAREAVWVGG
jgi:hypothetical protein